MSKNPILLHGDCRTLLDDVGRFNLIFADPPFNIGVKYRAWDDNMDTYSYETFTHTWVKKCAHLLYPGGRLCIHVPDKCVKTILNAVPSWLPLDEWIIWHYRFGVYTDKRFIPSKCHCLVFREQSAPSVFHPTLVPSDRASKYNDIRTPHGKRPPFDVWGLPEDGPYWGRVQGNNAERQDTMNQLPEVYLKRIIESYTDPGDSILDPFCGSGTTVTVATSLGRQCTTIDIDPVCLDIAKKRIAKGMVR